MVWPAAIAMGTGLLAVGGLLYWLASPLAGMIWLAMSMLAVIGFQAFYLNRLYQWTLAPQGRNVPFGPRAWGEVFDRIAQFTRAEHQARRELTEEAERIRAIVDRLPDALVVLDARNMVQWCNRAGERLHGIFTTRKTIQQFIREPDFIAYLARGEYSSPLQIELSSQHGLIHEIRIHLTEDGKKLLVTRDVSQQARLNRMRSDFVANVSHEIRTPVTVIGGFAETMLDIDLDEPTRRHYLQEMLRQSHTMQRLLEDLLTLSSLEAALDEKPDEVIDLGVLFRLLSGEARALSGGRHSIVADEPTGVALIGRPTEIESAVRNLLSNAVRYTPDKGCIELRWQVRGDEGLLSVQDNGIGIAAEHLPRLSERFYRVDRGRSRSSGGTGLGLAIVKHIIGRHNGSLQIDSTPGAGSRFTLVLPARRIAVMHPSLTDEAASEL